VLLATLVLPFEVEAPDVDETLHAGELPRDSVLRLARAKAERVAAAHPGAWALGSDTLVALGAQPLGKPLDPADARRMLTALSGRGHQVWTGIALARHGQTTQARAEVAQVAFRPLSEQEIAAYVATGEPLDKAGAYALQGGARAFVRSVEGDETTVIGLPVAATRALLVSCGFDELAS
jgi:septum formation protein